MANFLNVGIPSAILAAVGSAPEQRERADRLAQLEAQRQYQAERLGLDRETLAETRRQHDLQYGPSTINVPGVGEITGPRWAIPSLIQAASAREREVSPTELGALATIRERIVNPQVGGMVDLPQDIRLPRTSVEKLFTEAGAQRKEVDLAAAKQKQGLANARYRQAYSLGIAQGIPHPVADAMAIETATKEFGVAPEREAFATEPREGRQPTEASLAFDAARGDPAKALDILKKQKREVGRSKVDLALEVAGGDPAKAIAILDRDEQRERDSAWAKASTILTQARNIRSMEQGRFGKIIMDPVEEENVISRIANQLAVGTRDPLVQDIVRTMMGGLGGGVQPPGAQPPVAPPTQPRPAPAVRPPAPAGAPETLSRRDTRYSKLQGRGLSDQQIETQFGVRIVP